MTAILTSPARRWTHAPRAPRPLVGKLPVAILIVAIVIAGVGVLGGKQNDPVAEAIEARFIDVGILPIDRSLAFWQARVDADPADSISKTRLATTFMAKAKDTGDLSLYDSAEAVLRDALAINPHDEAALLALGSARAANHDFTTSLHLAEQVLARNPDSQAAQVAIADDNFELGNYAVASRQLDRLLSVLPEGIGVDSRLAKRAAAEGRLDDAIRASAAGVIAASDLDLRASEAAFYRFQLGHFLAQAGRLDDALRVLDAGLAIDPQHLASLEAKAQVLVSLGRLGAAHDLYTQLVDRTPAADLYGELAKVDRALGNDAAAESNIAQGLEIGHEQLRLYPAERRHLAGFFAEFEPETALAAAKADFKTRQDIGAYDTLAWAYFQNGQPRVAARYVRGALTQGTRDAALLAHAGMIEAAVGHTALAQRHLRAALTLNPHFDLVQAPRAAHVLAELER